MRTKPPYVCNPLLDEMTELNVIDHYDLADATEMMFLLRRIAFLKCTNISTTGEQFASLSDVSSVEKLITQLMLARDIALEAILNHQCPDAVINYEPYRWDPVDDTSSDDAVLVSKKTIKQSRQKKR